jgi:hypothetical protein
MGVLLVSGLEYILRSLISNAFVLRILACINSFSGGYFDYEGVFN